MIVGFITNHAMFCNCDDHRIRFPSTDEKFGNVQRHFQQYVSYSVAVSFLGGGNRSTRRKPPTYSKSI
jgi:hypothetical protein